jgi:hypothetical protein
MCRVGLLTILFALYPVAAWSASRIDPCTQVGLISFEPSAFGPPGPDTVIGYRVEVPPYGFDEPYPPYIPSKPGPQFAVVRGSFGPGNIYFIDVVVTHDLTPFPAYHQVGYLDRNFDFIGPFSPGTYTFTATVRSYDSTTGTLVPFCPAPYASSYTRALMVATVDPQLTTAPVIEYYYSKLDHYFITQDPVEIQALDAGAHFGWVRTGQSFPAYVPGSLGVNGFVWRYYGLPSAGLDSHFFTLAVPEQNVLNLEPDKWVVERQDAFELLQPLTATGYCPPNTIPAYRLWNNRADGDHRYTTDTVIKRTMIGKGYIAEGYGPDAVFMCAPTQ